MKKLTKDKSQETSGGGCDFLTGVGCGASIGAVLSGVGVGVGLLFAIGSCGSMINDCRKK